MSMVENGIFERRFLPTVRNIVGPHLIIQAPLDLDMSEGTDLMVLRGRDLRIACRIRRMGYWDRYPWQFTMRSKLENGAKTELAKMIEGFGDWFFYGHEHSKTSIAILRWFIIDLAHWRAHMMRRTVRWGKDIPNGDGTFFRAFDLRDFHGKPPICAASSHPIPQLFTDFRPSSVKDGGAGERNAPPWGSA